MLIALCFLLPIILFNKTDPLLSLLCLCFFSLFHSVCSSFPFLLFTFCHIRIYLSISHTRLVSIFFSVSISYTLLTFFHCSLFFLYNLLFTFIFKSNHFSVLFAGLKSPIFNHPAYHFQVVQSLQRLSIMCTSVLSWQGLRDFPVPFLSLNSSTCAHYITSI